MSKTLKPNRTIEVFVSYAHEDEELWNELSKHLSILKRRNVISVWHDRKIGAGREWKNEIDSRLNTAHIILLLVSADFLASDYCHDVEMKKAMEQHEARQVRVIPVILRDCDLEHSIFSKLNYLPTDGKAVTNPKYWSTRDEAFRNIAEGIRHAVDELIESQIKALSGKLINAESLGNWPNVIDLGERILRMAPDHKATRSRTAAAYINKWSRKIKSEDVYEIIGSVINFHLDHLLKSEEVRAALKQDLLRASALDAENAESYYWRSAVGRILFHQNEDYEDQRATAIADLTRAIELEPQNGKYYYRRAQLLKQGLTGTGDEDAARRDLDRAVALGDKNATRGRWFQ